MPTKNGYYLSNPNLPKAGSQYKWTQEMVAEYTKCMKDPVYFAETYFRIIHVDHGLIPLKLYDFQREAIRAYLKHKKILLNTSRQVGKTTVATAIILHFALFNPAKRIAVLANKGEMAREILERIQTAYEYLPDYLKGGVREWNKGSVVFENKSKIVASASSGSAIRGKSQSLIYIDEAAFVPNWEEFSASVLPTMSSGKESISIFTSTPNGLNHFYEYVQGAKNGTNGFYYIEVPWHLVPGRDEAWKQDALKLVNYDLAKFAVEYECAFEGSSGTLISGATLKRLKPITPIARNKSIRQYEAPVPGHNYVISVDVSRGKGLDYSAFHVIDVTTTPFKQVLVFHDNMVTPPDYAVSVFQFARMYNEAYVLVEVNDIGGQVSDALHEEFEYENIIYTESSGRSGKKVSGGFGRSADRGIRTTSTVKKLGCSILKLLIEQDQLTINDKETIQELNTFSKKGQSYEAEQGKHDDLVMGLVLFAWLSQDKFFVEINDVEVMKRMRERTSEEAEEELVPFGFRRDGLEDIDDGPVQMDGSLWDKPSVGVW